VWACAAQLPRPGRAGRVEGQLEVAVRGGQVAIVKAMFVVHGPEGQDADDLRQCAERAAIGLATASPGEPDLDGYAIHVSYAIR